MKNLKSAAEIILELLGRKTPNQAQLFETLYSLKKDPWGYSSSEYEKKKYRETLEMISFRKWERVLEVGCSEGIFTGMLSEYCLFLTAVDISPTAIERAKQRNAHNPNIEFLCLDIEKNAPCGKFDLIVCSEVLYYLDDKDRITAVRDRFISMLKENGYILLVHMRRLSDDEMGHPAPITGYPKMGAKTVHQIFADSQDLKIIAEKKQPMYVISLYFYSK